MKCLEIGLTDLLLCQIKLELSEVIPLLRI